MQELVRVPSAAQHQAAAASLSWAHQIKGGHPRACAGAVRPARHQGQRLPAAVIQLAGRASHRWGGMPGSPLHAQAVPWHACAPSCVAPRLHEHGGRVRLVYLISSSQSMPAPQGIEKAPPMDPGTAQCSRPRACQCSMVCRGAPGLP